MAPLAALLLAASPAEAAVSSALAVPDARAEVKAVSIVSGARCVAERAVALRAVGGSGQVPLRLEGHDPAGAPCVAHGWATVRVLATGLVVARALRAGEPLEGAVRPAELEVQPGRAALATLPRGAVASRALRPGEPLVERALRDGPEPGAPVSVVVRAGGVEVSRPARALACGAGRACALLPGGRRVEGRREGTVVVLEAP